MKGSSKLILAIASAGFVLLTACGSDGSTPDGTTSQPDPAQTQVETGEPGKQSPLDPEVATGLKRWTDIEILDGNVAENPPVTAAQAIATARADFPDAGEATASLVRAVTFGFGEELETDPSKPSRVIPGIDGEVVWAVVFTDVPARSLSGRPGSEKPGNAKHRGTIVEFVDTKTGDVIYGTSF